MIKANTFLALPLWFKNICQIYPPRVNDVVENLDFSKYKSILLLSAEEVEDIFVEQKQELENYPTPLEFLLANSYNSKEYEQLAKEAFSFFIREEVVFLYDLKAIWIGGEKVLADTESIDQVRVLTEENFFDFQNALREAVGENSIEPPIKDEDPRIKRIKAKARYRDRIKAKKADGVNLTTSLASICCMGIGLTPLNIGELSYAAVSFLTRTYQEKEKYETDLRSLLAGADSKKIKLQYWIRNLED